MGGYRLTPLQEKFCQMYVNTGNAAKSYKDAFDAHGKSSALKSSYNLMKKPHIQERIKEIQEEANKHFKITREDLIRVNVEVAFSKLSEVIEIVDGDLQFKEGADLDHLDAIGYSRAESQSINGSSRSKSITVKRPDRVKATQELARLLGLYNQTGDDNQSRKENAMKLFDIIKKYNRKEICSKEQSELDISTDNGKSLPF